MQRGRYDGEVLSFCAAVEATIPNREDEVGVVEHERTREMHGVCAAQPVASGEPTGGLFDLLAELDGLDAGPELLPALFALQEFCLAEVTTSPCCGQRGTDFGICEPAGEGGITSIPDCRCDVASGFVDDQLHQRAGVEVCDCHYSASLFAHPVRQRRARTRQPLP